MHRMESGGRRAECGVYRAYWKTHPVFMLLGIGLRIWIEMLLGHRVVVSVDPDKPSPLAGVNE